MGGTSTSEVGVQAPSFHRFKVGAFTAGALHDGVPMRDRPPHSVRTRTPTRLGKPSRPAGWRRTS